jgi:hypothetical protein
VNIQEQIVEYLARSDSAAAGVALAEQLSAHTADMTARRQTLQAKALSPQTSPKEAGIADAEAGQLRLSIARAEALSAALTAHLALVREKETEADRLAAYEEAVARGDAIEARIRDEYPEMVTALVALLAELKAARVAIGRVNNALPSGKPPLGDPETTARGVAPNWRHMHGMCERTKLPDPHLAESLAWPIETRMGVSFSNAKAA